MQRSGRQRELVQVLAVILAVVGLPAWLVSLISWRRLFVGLLLFTPVAGVFTLALYPDDIPKLFKDILFLIPLYFVFFVLNGARGIGAAIPQVVLMMAGVFAGIVVLQLLNPSLAAFAVGIIGLKVTLSYLPLIFVAAAYLQTAEDLRRLMRLLTAVAMLPCAVGLIQWFLGVSIGYEPAMVLFFGPAAEPATQGFASFQYGGTFMRIPSTFTFVTQYSQFLLLAIVPAYATALADTSALWRRFGFLALVIIISASFLSGARTAIVFVPFLMGMIVLLDGRVSSTLVTGLFLPVLLFVVLTLGGVDPLKVLDVTGSLMEIYGTGIASMGFWDALADYPLGLGTGMGSIAARHVLPEGSIQSIENYYAKTVMELGIPGFLAVSCLLLTILVTGLRAVRTTADRRLKTAAAALYAYLLLMVIQLSKGWVLDLDPANVFFWVYIGLLMKVPHLRSGATDAHAASGVETHPFIASLRRPPTILGKPGGRTNAGGLVERR